MSWSRAAGGRFTTKPPFEPTGTMTAFFTVCAFMSPRISVRKSSLRSDQRMPPRATLPARICTPSTRGLDVDLVERARQREQIDLARGDLYRERRLRCASREALVITSTYALQHEGQKAAQDTIFVEALDRLERVIDRLH